MTSQPVYSDARRVSTSSGGAEPGASIEKPIALHKEGLADEEGGGPNIDQFGGHEKTDPAEIALVRKLDRWIMPTGEFLFYESTLVMVLHEKRLSRHTPTNRRL